MVINMICSVQQFKRIQVRVCIHWWSKKSKSLPRHPETSSAPELIWAVSGSVGEAAVKHQFASQALLIYFHANAELCTDLEASKCRVCHGLITTLPMTMSIFGISDIHIWTKPCSHFKASENYKNFGSSTSQYHSPDFERCGCQGDVQKFFDCGFGAILCPEVCFLAVKKRWILCKWTWVKACNYTNHVIFVWFWIFDLYMGTGHPEICHANLLSININKHQ